MRIFIAGGSGFVGGRLTRMLLMDRHDLKLLAHRRSTVTEPGISRVPGDVTSYESFADQLKGCDAVINLVGIIREFPSKGITFPRLHQLATENLVQAAREAGVTRFLQMSALGARAEATSLYHRSKFEAEEIVRESGLTWTIFRPSVIFGERDAFVNLLAGYIRNYPGVPVIGDGRYRLQPIAADDVSRCFSLSLDRSDCFHKTFELCGADRFSYNEMLDTIGRALGKRRVPKLNVPLGFMELVVPALQRFSFFPITMDQISMLVEENICDGSWRTTFGFEPEKFESGIRQYLSS